MKPLRLEVRGFTAFRRAVTVDFGHRSLFAITGATGAGKSSLLDAMTWALYGQVPRVGRSTHQLVTHGEKSMSVRFDFEAHGQVYRVTRSTAGPIGARLEQRFEGGGADAEARWRLLADRANDVTKQLSRLIGLDYQTFTKTIVLPQGEFGSFLRGEDRERREILSTLLGLATYEAVGRQARGRARDATQRAQLLQQQLHGLALADPGVVAELEAGRDASSAALDEGDAMRARLVSVTGFAEAYVAAARDAEEARRASTVAQSGLEAATSAVTEARAQLERARGEQARLERERDALGYDADAHVALRRTVELLDARLAAQRAVALACRAAAEAEQSLVATEERAAHATLEATAAAAALQEATTRCGLERDALRAAAGAAMRLGCALGEREAGCARALQAAEDEARAQERLADRLRALSEQLTQLEAERAVQASALAAVARAVEDAETRAVTLDGAYEAATRDASARRAHLEAARVEHAAADLRATLEPGHACPVCGSVVGQMPLHAVGDLDAAQQAVAAAEAILIAARAQTQAAAAEVAGARARRDEVSVASARLEERARSLVALVAEAGVALEDGASLDQAVDEARARAGAAATEVATLRASVGAAREERHSLELVVAEARSRLGGAEDLEAALEADSLDAPLETPAVVAAVEAALASFATAGDEASRAREQARATADVASVARDAHERAVLAVAERRQGVTQAEAQLATLPGADVESEDAARAALVAAGQAAQAAEGIATRLQAASTAVAVLAARLEDREGAVVAATEEAHRALERAGAAHAASDVARTAFASSWREVLGDTHEADPGALRLVVAQVEIRAREAAQALGAVEARLEQARREVVEAQRLRAEIASCEGTARVAGALEQELHADRFIAYVQREAMGVLAADASSRLLHLTGGRYRLVTEQDEFFVVDHLNGDERRSVRTLSGGETFLASLALALALSERLPELAGSGGAVALESLFLDEGFGSLDAASLDVAIEGLERLAGGRRMIGVISHVPEIAERLPDRIEVLKAPEGSTVANGRGPELVR